MRRVPRVQPLQFPPFADRTAATQVLIRSMRDALSGIFDVADPSGTVTLTSPVWVPGWHVPLLKLTKAAIAPNRDDTHDLHRLIDDLFSQLQERMTSGPSGPVAFKTLLADFADYFDRAPRGAALATLQHFGVRTGTHFASYLRALRVVVASTVEKGGPLAPSSAIAIELVRIRTARQYPMLMPTLFPGDLATREKPYVTLTSMWTAFNDLKHNMSPAIDGDAFASATRTSGSHASPTVAVRQPQQLSRSATTVASRDLRILYRMSHMHTLAGTPFGSTTASGPSMTKITTPYVPSLIRRSTLTCPCGHPFSLRTPAGKNIYSIAAVVVIEARRNTAYVGARLLSRMFFPSSTRNLPHMTRMDLYSNRGKRACASGGVVTPTASTKVMAGVMLLEITTPAPTIKVMVTLTTKVTVTGPHHGHTSPQLRLNL